MLFKVMLTVHHDYSASLNKPFLPLCRQATNHVKTCTLLHVNSFSSGRKWRKYCDERRIEKNVFVLIFFSLTVRVYMRRKQMDVRNVRESRENSCLWILYDSHATEIVQTVRLVFMRWNKLVIFISSAFCFRWAASFALPRQLVFFKVIFDAVIVLTPLYG